MLDTPLTTAVSVTFSLDKKCIYSVAERIYDHIQRETLPMRASLCLSARRELNERGKLLLCRGTQGYKYIFAKTQMWCLIWGKKKQHPQAGPKYHPQQAVYVFLYTFSFNFVRSTQILILPFFCLARLPFLRTKQ